ncbi:MAG: hypothetical protein ABR985_15730 [Methanotrichaceae archaeon]|jgi:hypothetical protein
MSRFSPLIKRLSRLEPVPGEIEPWPPEEGSFSWCLFLECGQPAERIGFWEMYHEVNRSAFAEDES